MYLRQRKDDTGKYPSNTEVSESGVAVDFARKERDEEDEAEADMTTCNLKDQEADLIASEFCEQRDCECTWLRRVSLVRTFTLAVQLLKDNCCGRRERELEIDHNSIAMALSQLVYKSPVSVLGMQSNRLVERPTYHPT